MRCLQTLGAIWISSEVGGARFTDLLGELNSVFDGLGGGSTLPRRRSTNSCRRGECAAHPAMRLVADVDDAAWFQLGIDKLDDGTPIVIAHPRPDAVQRHEIDARHPGRQHLREALFEKRDVLNASRCRKPLRASDMGWVEVHAQNKPVRSPAARKVVLKPVSAP